MSSVNRDPQTDGGPYPLSAGGTYGAAVPPAARRATLRREKPRMAVTWGEMAAAWPYSTFLIVLNEFCQKFAALSTILPLYLLNVLKFNANETTIFMQIYQIFGGIFPLFGSALADGYIGKFWTILYGTLLYGVGKVLMSTAAFMRSGSAFHPWLDFLGIFVIIVGMGGIVPCVASFGGDQFESHQERMISVFFSIFYASINAGALISTIMMPLLRSQPCLDQDSCYPLSFGVSATFMIISAIIFVVGSRWYKKAPPKGNVFADVYRTCQIARINKRYSQQERPHWLYYFLDTHDCQLNQKCQRLKRRKKNPNACERAKFLEDIRSLFRILVMYLPLPMFWALYDQQYSVWLIQAIQMDCRLWGDVLLLPDMMQFVNPVLILVFIFLFESIIYPIASHYVKLTPLRKMVAGGVLASLAFFVSAQVQEKVNTTLPEMPQPGHAFVSFMNTFENCSLKVSFDGDPEHRQILIPAKYSLTNNKLLNKQELFRVPLSSTSDDLSWSIEYDGVAPECPNKNLPNSVKFPVSKETIYFVSVGQTGAFLAKTDPAKPTGGTGEFSMALNVAFDDGANYTGNFALCRATTAERDFPCDPQQPENFYFWETNYDEGKSSDFIGTVPMQYAGSEKGIASLYKYKPVRPGKWNLFYMENTPKSIGQRTMSKWEVNVNFTGVFLEVEDQGGVYAIVLTGTRNETKKHVFQVVPSNTVSILWQVPQIAIITAAEILFSITGYEFAYSQSGASMKSIMQALWFLTVALGDLIIIVVTLLDFPDMALQFNIYAVVMLVVIFIFALMSIFYYEYRVNSDEDAGGDDDEDEEFEEDLTGKNQVRSPLPKAAIISAANGIGIEENGFGNGGGPVKNRKGAENLGYQKELEEGGARF